MPNLFKDAVGTIVRSILLILFGWAVKKNIITQENSTELIGLIVPAALIILWGIYQKYASNLKLAVALKLPENSTPIDVKSATQALTVGEKISLASSVKQNSPNSSLMILLFFSLTIPLYGAYCSSGQVRHKIAQTTSSISSLVKESRTAILEMKKANKITDEDRDNALKFLLSLSEINQDLITNGSKIDPSDKATGTQLLAIWSYRIDLLIKDMNSSGSLKIKNDELRSTISKLTAGVSTLIEPFLQQNPSKI